MTTTAIPAPANGDVSVPTRLLYVERWQETEGKEIATDVRDMKFKVNILWKLSMAVLTFSVLGFLAALSNLLMKGGL